MASSGLKKYIRKDPVQSSAIQKVPELHGSIFVYGRIGGGKSVSLLSIAQAYHDHPGRKYKIFDIWGGDRNENLYWTLPSTKISYWKKIKKALRLDGSAIKQYRVNLLYPMLGKIPKKLPDNEFVRSKIFTIPFTSLDIKDFPLISGVMSSRDEALWNEIVWTCKGKSITYMLNKIKILKAQNYTIYKNALRSLSRELLLQPNGSKYNIDIVSELDNQESITVLCLDFVPEEFKVFIAGYIIRIISEEIKKKRRKSLMLLREVHQFFRVSDSSVVPDRIKVFKTYLAHWIKLGRSGTHFILDTQSPSETRGIAEGQQDTTFFGRLPAQNDRQSATEQMLKDNLITQKQVTKLGILKPGQFIICPSGERAYFQYFFLPKSRYWEEGDGSFYKSIWKRAKDEWIDSSNVISYLKEQRKNEENEVDNSDEVLEKIMKSMDNKNDDYKTFQEEDNGDDVDNDIKTKNEESIKNNHSEEFFDIV